MVYFQHKHFCQTAIIYFYSKKGNFKPANFYAIILLIRELKQKNRFNEFTDIRKDFEEFIYKNDYISLVWQDTRLDLLDTDGNYIEFLFDSCFYEVDKQNEMIQAAINEFEKCNDDVSLSKTIKAMFDSILKIDPECTKEDIADLREQWGDEYVCRVGSVGLVIKE